MLNPGEQKLAELARQVEDANESHQSARDAIRDIVCDFLERANNAQTYQLLKLVGEGQTHFDYVLADLNAVVEFNRSRNEWRAATERFLAAHHRYTDEMIDRALAPIEKTPSQEGAA